MSVLAINAVFDHSKSRGVARLVLLAIADRADDTGRAYPGTTDICCRTNCSRRAVISARQELVELGELVVERDGGSSGEGRFSNRYRINLPPVQPVHPRTDRTSAVHARTSANPAPEPVQPLHPCADHTSAVQTPTSAIPAPEPVQTAHPNHHKPSKNHHNAKPECFDAGSVELENGVSRKRIPPRRNEEYSKRNFQIELPFSSAAFSEAWKTWLQHRREKRQPLTPTATRLQLSKLSAMGEARAIAAIEHSVSGNYQGIFEARGAPVEKPRYCPIGRPLNETARRQVASRPEFNLV